MNMNLKETRVIDPVLTKHALGYKHAERVGHKLFPRVEVESRGGNVIEFNKDSFRKINMRRAPGADTGLVSFGYVGKPFSLVQDALDSAVPVEILGDAQTVPNIDLGARAVNNVMAMLTLSLEIDQAELATNPENYSANNKMALGAQEMWNNPDSDPSAIIDIAKDSVRMRSGIEPNRMVLSKKVYKALCRHPKIQEQFKYTSSDSINVDMLANYFELSEIAVGKSMYWEGDDAEDANLQEIWKNSAVLAYVPERPMGFEEPSFGYTYTLKSHPYVEKARYEGSKKSWVYGVTYERVPVLSGIDSGFLIMNPIG